MSDLTVGEQGNLPVVTGEPIEDLAALLREPGPRAYFDRGNDCTKPCTFCGTRPAPTHETMRIGTYPNGDPIRRPVCQQCRPVVEARAVAAPPQKLPENVCSDCRLPRCPEGEPWDLGTHCPKTLRGGGLAADRGLSERDCLRIGLDKAHANEARMRGLLATVGEALDAAIAAQGEGS